MKDLGHRIRKLAQEMTPEALDELLALTHTMVATGRPSQHVVNHRRSEPHGWLSRRGLVAWRALGWQSWDVRPTRLGHLVMLARVEDDLRSAGKLPPEPPVEPE